MTVTLAKPWTAYTVNGKAYRFPRGTQLALWGLYGRVMPAGPYLRLTWTYARNGMAPCAHVLEAEADA